MDVVKLYGFQILSKILGSSCIVRSGIAVIYSLQSCPGRTIVLYDLLELDLH